MIFVPFQDPAKYRIVLVKRLVIVLYFWPPTCEFDLRCLASMELVELAHLLSASACRAYMYYYEIS